MEMRWNMEQSKFVQETMREVDQDFSKKKKKLNPIVNSQLAIMINREECRAGDRPISQWASTRGIITGRWTKVRGEQPEHHACRGMPRTQKRKIREKGRRQPTQPRRGQGGGAMFIPLEPKIVYTKRVEGLAWLNPSWECRLQQQQKKKLCSKAGHALLINIKLILKHKYGCQMIFKKGAGGGGGRGGHFMYNTRQQMRRKPNDSFPVNSRLVD